MKIAFFGTPAFAIPSLEQLVAAGEQVVTAITQPDRPRGRGHRVRPSPVKTAALAHGIPVLQPERVGDPAFAAALASCGADLGSRISAESCVGFSVTIDSNAPVSVLMRAILS